MSVTLSHILAIGLLTGTMAAATAADSARGLGGRSSEAQDACDCDSSAHKVRFVTVEPGVQLEVLDWGGHGEPLVLLAGLGDNAHVFDDFAYQFVDRFRVIAITRRGFGKSSQPADGYDVATRARDDIAVLDALRIRRANFMGHSIAGTEMNVLGADWPDRVRKLVYLDALDLGSGGWTSLPQPPPAPDLKRADMQSVQHLAAADARDDGYRKPLAALCNSVVTSPSGRVLEAVTPPEISQKIIEGLRPADYSRIQAPTLAILNRITPDYRLPYYDELTAEQRSEFDSSIRPLSVWSVGAIDRFRSGVKNARVVELVDENHYFFIVDESFVTAEVRRFLLSK
jgi:pimeloyl-ACP methyl ester carboxylesterase